MSTAELEYYDIGMVIDLIIEYIDEQEEIYNPSKVNKSNSSVNQASQADFDNFI